MTFPSETPSDASTPEPHQILAHLRAQSKAALWPLVGFSLAANLLMLTVPLYMLQVFDRVLSSGRLETLVVLTLIAAVALVVFGLVDYARSRILSEMGLWLERAATPVLVDTAVQSSERESVFGSSALKDLASIKGFVAGGAIKSFLDVAWAPIYLFVLWSIHPLIGSIGLLAVSSLAMIALLSAALNAKPRRKRKKLLTIATGGVGRAFAAPSFVRSSGVAPAFVDKWQVDHDRFAAAERATSTLTHKIGCSAKSLRLMLQILVLGGGAMLVVNNEITAGGMVAGSILLGRCLGPFEQSLTAWPAFREAHMAYKRLSRFLTETDRPHTADFGSTPFGRLACDQVTMLAPTRTDPVLVSVTFDVEPGTIHIILGPTGAGKSCVAGVLAGATSPTRGGVTLGGAVIRALPPEIRRRSIGYASQRPVIFKGSVADNISKFDPQVSEEDVVEAARLVGCHDAIQSLPNGYREVISDQTRLLSDGQLRLIGLARAFYARPPLIILDEPTNDLDTLSERAIARAVVTAKSWDSCIVLVSQRPAMIQIADTAMTLIQGRIRAIGPCETVVSALNGRKASSNTTYAEGDAPPPAQTPPPESIPASG